MTSLQQSAATDGGGDDVIMICGGAHLLETIVTTQPISPTELKPKMEAKYYRD